MKGKQLGNQGDLISSALRWTCSEVLFRPVISKFKLTSSDLQRKYYVEERFKLLMSGFISGHGSARDEGHVR